MVPCPAKDAGVGCCGFACVVDGLEKVTPFKIAIFGIYARFLGCKFFEQKSFSHPAGEEN